jgi:hypothetical protein
VTTVAVAKQTSTLDQQAIDWLLASDEPGIRLQTRRDLLDEKITWTADEVLRGRHASSLLSGQKSDGGFGTHPYNKWMGAHWRIISLVELGLPPAEPRALSAEETVLDWLMSEEHRTYMPTIRGLPRQHGSMEGNALAVCCRLGMSSDPRVVLLAESLIEWQWPDGGWNCDKTPATTHSSFYESLPPVWGLTEYSRATGSREAAAACRRAADFFLDHHVFQSHTTGEIGDPKWMKLRYPEYWHYDFLHGLVMLARAGALPDTRADEAITQLRQLQQPDGRWLPSGNQYWKGGSGSYGDAARWDKTSVSQMLTLNALRVLRNAAA